MSYKQQGFINAVLLIVALALLSCSKDPACERFTGDLLIKNTTENKQRVSVDALIVVMMDAESRLTIHDLTKGNYEVKSLDLNTGSSACVFVEIKPCEESEVII